MTVVVTGLAEVQRDLERSSEVVAKSLREGLRYAATPTARTAEAFSLEPSRIRRMHRSPEWAETRVGVTRKMVYVVPKKRGVAKGHPGDPRRRPKLVELMMGRSFEPAAKIGEPIAEARVSALLRSYL